MYNECLGETVYQCWMLKQYRNWAVRQRGAEVQNSREPFANFWDRQFGCGVAFAPCRTPFKARHRASRSNQVQSARHAKLSYLHWLCCAPSFPASGSSWWLGLGLVLGLVPAVYLAQTPCQVAGPAIPGVPGYRGLRCPLQVTTQLRELWNHGDVTI